MTTFHKFVLDGSVLLFVCCVVGNLYIYNHKWLGIIIHEKIRALSALIWYLYHYSGEYSVTNYQFVLCLSAADFAENVAKSLAGEVSKL